VTTTLPNGVVTINGYDDANRLTSLVHTDENEILLASFLYRLDKVGNRVVVTETLSAPSTSLFAALPAAPDYLADHEGPVTSDVVLAAVTGAGTADSTRLTTLTKPSINTPAVPYPWSMNAAELVVVPPEQVGAADLIVRLARTRLTADGRTNAPGCSVTSLGSPPRVVSNVTRRCA
jgi:hypothetical protein